MDTFEALGNQVRRDILVALRDEALAVGELAARFPVSRPAISRHLKVLEEAQLVRVEHQGTRSLYSLRPEGLTPVQEFIGAFWDEALANLARLARE